MKRKGKLTRRDKALFRGAVLLLLLALYIAGGNYGLSPERTVRETEELLNCAPTEKLMDGEALSLPGIGRNRVELRGNGDVLLLLSTRWKPLSGWQRWGFDAVDCGGAEPVCLAAHRFGREEERVLYFFGRIDFSEAAVLQVEVGYEGEEWVKKGEAESPRSTWLERGETCYVLFALTFDKTWERRDWIYPKARILDGMGNVLWEDDSVPMGAG